MQETYLQHPNEEALERFLLNQAGEEELDVIETHILACESCVYRLENLETDIAATKIALNEVRIEKLVQAQERSAKKESRKKWFGFASLSSAAAAAALLLGIFVLPQFKPVEISLSANRGNEMTQVPENRPLHLNVPGYDIPDEKVNFQLVDATGKLLWTKAGAISHEQSEVSVPGIDKAGDYFLRLYSRTSRAGEPELLREFALKVK